MSKLGTCAPQALIRSSILGGSLLRLQGRRRGTPHVSPTARPRPHDPRAGTEVNNARGMKVAALRISADPQRKNATSYNGSRSQNSAQNSIFTTGLCSSFNKIGRFCDRPYNKLRSAIAYQISNPRRENKYFSTRAANFLKMKVEKKTR